MGGNEELQKQAREVLEKVNKGPWENKDMFRL